MNPFRIPNAGCLRSAALSTTNGIFRTTPCSIWATETTASGRLPAQLIGLDCILRDSLKPLSVATTSNRNPVVVTRKVYVQNSPFLKQRIPAPDSDRIRIHCNNLILLNLFAASVISVKSEACVADGEMTEDTGKFLALLRGPTPTPNPILEGEPSVGAPCSEESLICYWFVRWHFTNDARCRLKKAEPLPARGVNRANRHWLRRLP